MPRLGVALALVLCGCPADRRVDAGLPAATPGLPAWAASRVGDRVDYVLDTEGADPAGANRREAHWKLGVEVVKVEPSAVWVAVRGTSATGRALGFLIAVSPREGPARRERAYARAADGGTFESHASATCRPWVVDQRGHDGPRVEGCESDEAPFHLLRSLAFENRVSGMGGFHRQRLEAVAGTRGAEAAAPGPLPDLPVLFPPEGWYRRVPTEANPDQSAAQFEEQVVGGTVVRRVRSLAPVTRTREDLARTDLSEAGGRHYVVADGGWSRLATFELVHAVLAVVRAVDAPAPEAEAGVLTVSTGALAVSLRAGEEAFAADVFDPKLAGLPFSGRTEAVQTRRDRLWDWGSGPLPMAPPAAAGTLPETLSAGEIDAVVRAARAEAKCPGGPVALKLDLAADGKPVQVVATSANKQAAACLEKALRKRTWPAHAGPTRSFEARSEP